MKYNKLYLILIFMLTVYCGFSQQLPQFTQYMYNTISINPAYAGSREALSIVGLHRSQWAGFDQAPETQTLSIHTPLRNDNMGVGLSLIRDQLGYENFIYAYGDVSYSIDINEKTKLAFGLKAGVTQYNLDEELIATESLDPAIYGVQNKWEFNMGAGMFLHTDNWYVGFSAPRMLNQDKNALNINDIEYAIVDRVSYYLTAGYVFDVNETIKFKPAFLVKATNGAPLSYDITANFLFNEKFWVGGSYRINEQTGALGALLDYQVTDSFRIGYAYEHPLSDINTYSNGTHEVLLMFEFLRERRVKSPRYF